MPSAADLSLNKSARPANLKGAVPTIFIDGEAGTTGLEIRQRLASASGVRVRSIDADKRKDPAARKALMAEVDVVVLCLPDDAAREAVELADSLGADSPRIIDASTAHRVAPGWTYGFPEMTAGHAATVAKARRVTNPGCYPTGAIALLRPLVETGLLPADFPVTVNAVSGYSGGGKSMIQSYEGGTAPAFELYGLGLEHKHVPELQLYSQLTRRPIFVPSVGNFYKGMLVSIPLHLDTLPGRPIARDLETALMRHYAGAGLVEVVAAADPSAKGGRLEPEALNGTNQLELRVFAHPSLPQAVLVARLDNLGKGASGAAVQNLGLMLAVAL
jgi:N-acetyl-gamma-glutamyl-phosphate reductase